MKFNKNSLGFSISLILIIVINFYLVSLPLTNLIGYEFSAINAIILSFLGGLYSLTIFRDHGSFGSSITQSSWKLFLLIFIPFLIGFTNHLLFEICPFTNDIFFYLLITIPAFLVALFISFWITNFIKRLKWLVFLIVYLHFIFVPLIEIYFNPQIYFYNPLILFFPGNIYDEDISINILMISYRILTLVVYSSFVYFSWLSKKYKPKFIFILLPVFLIASFIYLKPVLGYATDDKRMKNVLSEAYESEHFRYFFSHDIPGESRRIIMLQHEFHYFDIQENYHASTKDKITSYIFANGGEKRKYFGAENADVAKPWLHSIYINADNYFSSLRHEIAHIFSAEFGVTPFKVAAWINPALIEGYAMALENNFNDNTNHYLAWLARESGYSIPMNDLFSGQNFFKNASSLSYIISGSFVQFLMENYEPDSFSKIYSGDSFESVYGKSINELESEYIQFLNRQNYKLNESIAKFYFARKALIQKLCPRYTANRLKEAGELFLKESYMGSMRIYKEIFDYSKSYEALVGYCRSLNMLDEVKNSIEILEQNISIYNKTSYYNNLLIRLGDYYVLVDKYDSAYSYYQKLRDENPISAYSNAIELRMAFLPEKKSILKDYVEGSDETRLEIVMELLKNKFVYTILPIAIELNSRLKKDYKIFISNFADIVEPESNSGFYACCELGKYAISGGDFINAEKIFNKKMSYNSGSDNEMIYKQYNELASWLNANDSKYDFRKIK